MTGAQTTMGPRLQGEKLGAAVARRIESEIIDLGWPTGSVLGSEADLIARYGVSAPSRSMQAASDSPSRYSITTNVRPSTVLPKSVTLTTFG